MTKMERKLFPYLLILCIIGIAVYIWALIYVYG